MAWPSPFNVPVGEDTGLTVFCCCYTYPHGNVRSAEYADTRHWILAQGISREEDCLGLLLTQVKIMHLTSTTTMLNVKFFQLFVFSHISTKKKSVTSDS